MRVKFEEKISPDSPSMCVLKFSPFSAQQGESVASHLSPCINYDEILDVMRGYPVYKSYFLDKLLKVSELENRILNPNLRAKGESKHFLQQWRTHFIKQIKFMIEHLKKDKQNE